MNQLLDQPILLRARFDELRALQDGWYDGTGNALNPQALDIIENGVIGAHPEKLTLPAIVPTPDGNLLMEWNVSGEPSVDISLVDFTAHFHEFLPDGGDLEKDFTLNSPEAWSAFFGFLSIHIGSTFSSCALTSQ